MRDLFLTVSLATLSCFSWSCTSEEKVPENIISVDSMVHIVADMELIEAYVVSIKQAAKRDSVTVQQYNILFRKHNISREAYQESMDFFIKDRVMLRDIYTRALEELNEREAEVKTKAKKQ